MDKQAFIQFIIAMFAILNPIGSVAIFAGLTSGRSADDRKAIMIAQISLSMLHSRQNAMHQTADHDDGADDVAVVPLAMPMVAGPGAIVTVIVNTHQHTGMTANLEMSVVCVGLAAMIFVCFQSTGLITRVLGRRGMDILTKFMGMLLLAIAVGMFTTGLKALLPGLVG